MTTQPLITGIHHLALATADIEATLGFWRDLLGFQVVLGYGEGAERQYFLALDRHHMITFFEWPQSEPPPYHRPGQAVEGPFGFDHLALEVASKEGLFVLQERLIEKDFPVTEAVDHGFLTSIYTYDPNHIPVELTWADPAVDLLKNPRFAGADFSKRAHRHPPGPLEEEPQTAKIIPGGGYELFEVPKKNQEPQGG
ncbi:MAG: VOC family protein [bacterium]|nr:VOC family protein [bacterium]